MHVVVVGAGIVGLAVAARLTGDGHRVTVVEKEQAVAVHQTGRNSGVIHSGLYYTPGSLKARMSVAGQRSMTAYAREHGVAVEITGKLVVATTADQVAGLHRLAERARANGVPAQLVGRPAPASASRTSPASTRCGWRAPGSSTTPASAARWPRRCRRAGARSGSGPASSPPPRRPTGCTWSSSASAPTTELRADAVVACAGLHADRVARACGLDPSARIVPFRGEYFELSPTAAELVNGLVYPVPDPRFPFLGVHLTRMVGGGVHAGPERGARPGARGVHLARRRPARHGRRPDLAGPVADGRPERGARRPRGGPVAVPARVRAQPGRPGPRDRARTTSCPRPPGCARRRCARDGKLVDDFLLQRTARQVHVLNAPSPAATCALEIADHVVGQLALLLRPPGPNV